MGLGAVGLRVERGFGIAVGLVGRVFVVEVGGAVGRFLWGNWLVVGWFGTALVGVEGGYSVCMRGPRSRRVS